MVECSRDRLTSLWDSPKPPKSWQADGLHCSLVANHPVFATRKQASICHLCSHARSRDSLEFRFRRKAPSWVRRAQKARECVRSERSRSGGSTAGDAQLATSLAPLHQRDSDMDTSPIIQPMLGETSREVCGKLVASRLESAYTSRSLRVPGHLGSRVLERRPKPRRGRSLGGSPTLPLAAPNRSNRSKLKGGFSLQVGKLRNFEHLRGIDERDSRRNNVA